jgi:hypothetical protein
VSVVLFIVREFDDAIRTLQQREDNYGVACGVRFNYIVALSTENIYRGFVRRLLEIQSGPEWYSLFWGLDLKMKKQVLKCTHRVNYSGQFALVLPLEYKH